jgi:hypothetical protein
MFRYTEVPSYRGFTVIFNYQFIKIAYVCNLKRDQNNVPLYRGFTVL